MIYTSLAVLDVPASHSCGSWRPVFTRLLLSWTFLWPRTAVPGPNDLHQFGCLALWGPFQPGLKDRTRVSSSRVSGRLVHFHVHFQRIGSRKRATEKVPALRRGLTSPGRDAKFGTFSACVGRRPSSGCSKAECWSHSVAALFQKLQTSFVSIS